MRQTEAGSLGSVGLAKSGLEGRTREGKSEMYSSPDSAVLRTVIGNQSSRNDLRFYAKYYIGVAEKDREVIQIENFLPPT